jgi:hypothetical protein
MIWANDDSFIEEELEINLCHIESSSPSEEALNLKDSISGYLNNLN